MNEIKSKININLFVNSISKCHKEILIPFSDNKADHEDYIIIKFSLIPN